MIDRSIKKPKKNKQKKHSPLHQEIGATALTVNTHNTLTLRKVTSCSLRAPSDKAEPLVTGMTLLTQTVLLAADFNNSCLKLLRAEEAGEGWWGLAEVLPLKWRPYSVAKLSDGKRKGKSFPVR